MLDEILKVFKLTGLLDSVRGYIDTRISLFKADIENRVARVLTGVIMLMVFMVTFFIMIIFAGAALSLALNSWLESRFLGFVITGGLFLIVMLVAGANVSKGYFHRKIKAVIIELMNNEDKNG
jgi:hypothetical protein